jgi:Skp family chaperone for outer membrane proteins
VAFRAGFATFCVYLLILVSRPAGAQSIVSEQEADANPLAIEEGMSAQFAVERVGLVDLEGVLRASSGTSRVRALLDEQRLLFQAEFSEREAVLQLTERELLDIRSTISEDEFALRLSAFEDEVAQIQREIQYRRESLDLAFQDAQAKLRSLALDIITEIAREQRLDLILKQDSAVVFRPGLNISDELLRRLDERTKDARIEIEIDYDVSDSAGGDQ